MGRLVYEFLAVPYGAFIRWMLKGFQGTFDDQYNDKNFHINAVTGVISVLLTVGGFAAIVRFC